MHVLAFSVLLVASREYPDISYHPFFPTAALRTCSGLAMFCSGQCPRRQAFDTTKQLGAAI